MQNRSKQARGRWGEDLAVRHLRRVGYVVVERNWRSPERHVTGELDIVASLDDGIVVCEVKARRTSSPVPAAAAVDERKQAQIRAVTESWLRVAATAVPEFVRFDVIAIDGVRLTYLEGAF